MADLIMRVKQGFEQQNGTEENSGEPIIKKFVEGQELRGAEARFMYNKKGDDYLEVVTGIRVEGIKGAKTFEELKKESDKEEERSLAAEKLRKEVEEARKKSKKK